MTDLNKEDVLKLARLAKLELTEEEIKKYQSELSEILDLFEKLKSADISDLEPTTQVTGLKNVMRKDVEQNYGVSQQELLKNVPQKQGNNIKVRRVL